MMNVTIVQVRCEPYRVPFFEQLGDTLAQDDIRLEVIYGQSNKYEPVPIPHIRYGSIVRNRYIYAGKRYLSWQPASKCLPSSDLLICQHNATEVFNYVALARRRAHGCKFAFWGHGRFPMFAPNTSVTERLKTWLALRADHWFAYNDASKRVLVEAGFSSQHITSVQNAIDTRREADWYDAMPEAELAALRSELRIPAGAVVGLYLGRLYKEKRIDFLIEAAKLVRERTPNFHLVIVGEGEELPIVLDACESHGEWLHHVPSKRNREKIAFFKLADVLLVPGAVGLNIVDSFAFGTPMITTRDPNHRPEIDYLVGGVNGLMCEPDSASYAQAITDYLGDEARRKKLVRNCVAARATYTIEKMVQRFANGVKVVLGK